MSVIVYDGKSMVADRMSILHGLRMSDTKIYKVIDNQKMLVIVGMVGDSRFAGRVLRWMEFNLAFQASQREEYPVTDSDAEKYGHACLVVTRNKETGERLVEMYEQSKYGDPVNKHQRMIALGSGSDYAMGALAMGANAATATKVAVMLSSTCGKGYEGYVLETGEHFMVDIEADYSANNAAAADPIPEVVVAEPVEE